MGYDINVSVYLAQRCYLPLLTSLLAICVGRQAR